MTIALLLLLLLCTQSQALTLGRVQGAALIGRSLDLSVQVQLDPGQSISAACFEADVFHGDTRQNPRQVLVRVEPTQAAETVRLRILSRSPVDEPVVTIYLRAGCAEIISRRYVLLADIVSEQAPPPLPRVAAVPTVVPQAAGADAAATGASSSGSATGTAAAAGTAATQMAQTPRAAGAQSAPAPAKAPVSKPVRKKPPATKPAVSRPTPAPAPVPARPAKPEAPTQGQEKSAAAPATGQSRLKLDPLEVLSERVATLESNTANAQAEAATRDAQRLEALEVSIKTLMALSARNEASLLEMRARMQQAQDDRYNNPVVYVLAALLLASLAAIVYLLTRRQRHGTAGDNWWDSAEDAERAAPRAAGSRTAPSAPAPLSAPTPLSQPDSLPDSQPDSLPDPHAGMATQHMTQGLGLHANPSANTQADVSLVEMSESTFDRLMQSGAVHSAIRKPRDAEPAATAPGELPETAGLVAPMRQRMDSDEMFDVRQRAEFFVSLGQTDQAVQVLESRIAQEGESSPQAYLDLLKLFHSLGLKADYRQVREDFAQIFSARLPEFADFLDEGRSLEEYAGAVDRLTAAWGTSSVVGTIEAMMLRGKSEAQQIDLAAFRDLLTLHAVAQGVLSGANFAPSSFGLPLPELDQDPELDIDLSEALLPDLDLSEEPQAGAAAPAPAADQADSGNLIDFDLGELPFDKPSTPKR